VRMEGGVMHATVGGTVVLDASGSTDADGDTLGFTWTLTAHPAGSKVAASGSGPTFSWKPDVTGTYTYDVIVSDSKGGSVTQTVSVSVDNQAPAAMVTVGATFTATPQQAASQAVIVGGSVAIDASATADPDGDPVNVTFELVAAPGSAATLVVAGRTARFSPDQLGTYVVRVHGTDGRGRWRRSLAAEQGDLVRQHAFSDRVVVGQKLPLLRQFLTEIGRLRGFPKGFFEAALRQHHDEDVFHFR